MSEFSTRPPRQSYACSNPEHVRVVIMRHCNFSAFNGYHRAESAYSLVDCATCGRRWRTKAAYVDTLPDSVAAMRGSFYGSIKR